MLMAISIFPDAKTISNLLELYRQDFLKFEILKVLCHTFHVRMPGVGLMARVVGLGSVGHEFKSCLAVELISGGVVSACHPSEVGKMSTILLG